MKRLFRHLFSTQASGRKAFPCATLQAIKSAITEGERTHRAELRVIIEPALPLNDILERRSARDRAHELFSHYRIWDTEENCGILLYINLADHQVEIVVDRGIACCMPTQEWQAACHHMTQAFANGEYHDGVLAGIRHLNNVLARHFPERHALGYTPRNQLSDAPIIL
ncbi:TPM domain-containing protein [uncultured Oxalicibacterium sp.]|uniref:TPM domain-containing protein n=1 Tax=uncultured Oxalicibacterium sp. TaxID=1168540 RepID=UPI0025F39F80|nr:TPM domain-containing protein [uncultured Oxalicibacterium sp.]